MEEDGQSENENDGYPTQPKERSRDVRLVIHGVLYNDSFGIHWSIPQAEMESD